MRRGRGGKRKRGERERWRRGGEERGRGAVGVGAESRYCTHLQGACALCTVHWALARRVLFR